MRRLKDFWQKWFSYIKPQDTFYRSEVNDWLKVRWDRGKKILNTRHGNYSYGGLQEVLNYGLNSIPMKGVKSVLVLGMGGGCVVESLREQFHYNGPIVGVELDPVVIRVARGEFHLDEDKKVQIIEADAIEYVASTHEKYDLIVIDIFIDIQVPDAIHSKEFMENAFSLVADDGFVMFNVGIDLSQKEIDDFVDKISDDFTYQIILDVFDGNTLAILHKTF